MSELNKCSFQCQRELCAMCEIEVHNLKSDHVSKKELRSWCEWYLTDCDCWVGDAEDEGIKNVVRNMICKVIERFCKEETGNEG